MFFLVQQELRSDINADLRVEPHTTNRLKSKSIWMG